jgi:catechol 2,3-dioxygenase-like lactoylglutathione lyase family enzyme
MKVSHVHCRVRDLSAAARWFQQVLQAAPVFNNERMAWLGFGEFGVILDAAATDSALTLGFDMKIATRTTARSPAVGRTLRLPERTRRLNRRDRTGAQTQLSYPEQKKRGPTSPPPL